MAIEDFIVNALTQIVQDALANPQAKPDRCPSFRGRRTGFNQSSPGYIGEHQCTRPDGHEDRLCLDATGYVWRAPR